MDDLSDNADDFDGADEEVISSLVSFLAEIRVTSPLEAMLDGTNRECGQDVSADVTISSLPRKLKFQFQAII